MAMTPQIFRRAKTIQKEKNITWPAAVLIAADQIKKEEAAKADTDA